MGKDLKGKELGKYISQRADQLYMARFPNGYGGRNCIYDKNLKELQKKLYKALAKVEMGLMVKDEDIALNEWFEEWLQLYKAHCRNSTIETYKRQYRRIQESLGNVKLVNLNMRNIQTAILKINEDDARQTTLARLRDILDKAVKSELLVKNYAAMVTIPKRDKEKKEQRAMTVAEEKLLLEEMRHVVNYPIVVLSLRTGMRIGEVLGLTWDCIDWKKKKIHVKQTLCIVNKKFEIHPPKTNTSKRFIPMNPDVEILLKKQFENKQQILMSGKEATQGFENLVFVTKNNRPVYADSVGRALEDAVDRIRKKNPEIKFEYVHPHSLRHTFGTRAAGNGVLPKALQKLMGHATLQMTMDTYYHIFEDEVEDEMRKMEQFAVTV